MVRSKPEQPDQSKLTMRSSLSHLVNLDKELVNLDKEELSLEEQMCTHIHMCIHTHTHTHTHTNTYVDTYTRTHMKVLQITPNPHYTLTIEVRHS